MAEHKAGDWLEPTVHELEKWAAQRGDAPQPIDVAGARLLLELAEQDLELGGPGELTPELLGDLLLEVFPESVFVTTDEIPAVIATGRALVEFLAETERLPAERAAALQAELTRIEPEFGEAVAMLNEAEQEAAAEILGRMMADEGIDPEDVPAVERWVREFEELPEEERFSRTAGYLLSADELDAEDMAVAAVRLVPAGELCREACSSGLFEQVAKLAAWAGERPVTEEGELTADDAIAAAKALHFDFALGLDLGLGAGPDRQSDGEPDGEPAGLSENALPARLWRAALHAEVLSVEDGRVRPGPARELLDRVAASAGTGPEAEPDEEQAILDLWFLLLDGVLRPAHELHSRSTVPEILNHELPSTLLYLYEHEGPCARATLAEQLVRILQEEYGAGDAQGLKVVVDAVLAVRFADLENWGVLEETGEGYRLRPLGRWAVRESLLAEGFTAPVVGELATASAAELIDGLALYGDDTADEEIDGWLAARPTVEEAAADLLSVMAGEGPGARNLAAAILHRLGAEAEPAVRSGLEIPVVRPYAALWLRAHGDETVTLPPGETGWLFVDSVAGLLESGDAEEAVTAAVADISPEADLAAMCDELWRIDHPSTADVLDALGAHHPDKAVAKAARKAAFKARSRQEKG